MASMDQETPTQPGVVTSIDLPGSCGHITPPVTVIEYNYTDGRRPYHHHGNPYWR